MLSIPQKSLHVQQINANFMIITENDIDDSYVVIVLRIIHYNDTYTDEDEDSSQRQRQKGMQIFKLTEIDKVSE